MAYRVRVYAPTNGVLNLYITANGSSSLVYPAGESSPCYDNNIDTNITISPSISSDAIFSRWVINIDGNTTYSYSEYLSLNYNASWSNVYLRIEVTIPQTYYATIQFNANGGYNAPNSIPGSTTNADQYCHIQIPQTIPIKDGYDFLGWAFEDASSTTPDYYPGGTIIVYGTTTGITYTLYAVWKQSVSGGHIYIGQGSSFRAYEVWIYSGSWRRFTPYIYNGSWRSC